MKRISGLVSMLLAALLPIAAKAQLTTLTEYHEFQKDYLHDFFRPQQGKYVVFDYGSPHSAFSLNRKTSNTIVSVYDSMLNLSFTTPVEALQGHKYCGALEEKNQLHILFESKQTVFIGEMDLQTGQVSGAPVSLFHVTEEEYTFYYGFSPDSAYSYVFSNSSRKKDAIFDGVIMDRHKKVVTTFSIVQEEFVNTFQSILPFLSSEGVLYITEAIRLKKSKKIYQPYGHLIIEVNKEGKTITTPLADLPEGNIDHLSWQVTKDGLRFTGLLSKADGVEFRYLISGEYNSWRKKVLNIKETEISNDPYWSKITDKKLLEIKKDGIPAGRAILTTKLPDGTSIFVKHWYYTSTVERIGGNLSRTSQDTYGFNITAFSVSPDNKLNWIYVIPLYQVEPTYQNYVGSIAFWNNINGAFIFFNDIVSNENLKSGKKPEQALLSGNWSKKKERRNIATYVVNIKPDGSFFRTVAGNYLGSEHMMAPGHPFRTYENEVIITAYDRKNLGNSTYKPVILRIK